MIVVGLGVGRMRGGVHGSERCVGVGGVLNSYDMCVCCVLVLVGC